MWQDFLDTVRNMAPNGHKFKATFQEGIPFLIQNSKQSQEQVLRSPQNAHQTPSQRIQKHLWAKNKTSDIQPTD